MADRIEKTEAEWRAELDDQQFEVCRQKGTERAFTGKYWDTKTAGTYVCSCCGNPLFLSDHKYDSGTGWPSFSQPLQENAVDTEEDRSLFMRRTEVLCSACSAHLGHVFEDGPPPSGLRYCINSVSLKLMPEDDSGQQTPER